MSIYIAHRRRKTSNATKLRLTLNPNDTGCHTLEYRRAGANAPDAGGLTDY